MYKYGQNADCSKQRSNMQHFLNHEILKMTDLTMTKYSNTTYILFTPLRHVSVHDRQLPNQSEIDTFTGFVKPLFRKIKRL